jgi:hypothetical protein
MKPIEQRMAAAICEIMRGVWHDGWDESEIRDCAMRHDLVRIAVADKQVADMQWARDSEIGEGDDFEALDAELLALEKLAAETV